MAMHFSAELEVEKIQADVSADFYIIIFSLSTAPSAASSFILIPLYYFCRSIFLLSCDSRPTLLWDLSFACTLGIRSLHLLVLDLVLLVKHVRYLCNWFT